MISAWDKSLDILSRAEHSALDLKNKLLKKGYDREDVEDTIRRLCEAGYLSDERYARAYIRRNLASKDVRLICRELGQKGIRLTPEDPLVSEVLQEEEFSEEEALESLVYRKLRGKDSSDEKERRRLIAYLQRRGFSYRAIQDAVEHISV